MCMSLLGICMLWVKGMKIARSGWMDSCYYSIKKQARSGYDSISQLAKL